jgi:hypothetical protein
MADFIERITGEKLFSTTLRDDHLIQLNNEIDLDYRGIHKRYRITNIVTPVKRGWFGTGSIHEPKILLEEVERDTTQNNAVYRR